MIEEFVTYLSCFIAVFSTIALVRLVINFVSALISNPPRKMEIGERALIIYGLFLSYLICYLIYLIK